MNIELLKKLIKLANNNPNENEANLAARKVCKMIEEDQYKLVGGDQVQRRPIQAKQPDNPWDIINSYMRNREPFSWDTHGRSGYYESPFNTNYNPQEPISKEDVFHTLDRTVTVNCRKCGNKFKMDYDSYFGIESQPRKARVCSACAR